MDKNRIRSSVSSRRQLFVCIALMVMCFLVTTSVKAQSFSQLWSEVEKAQKADKPQSEITVLEQIITKAEKEKAYGQLMKAELMVIQCKNAISPDSLAPAFTRLVKKAEAQKKELPRAVYHAVIGKVLNGNYQLEKYTDKSSDKYFDIALANPLLLSKTKAEGYEPLVVKGKNGDLYNHDLLSVIAREARRPEVMRDCYNKQSKRKKAAMMATLESIEKDVPYSFYRKKAEIPLIASIDSLISIYGNMPECCEAAILRYRIMDHCKDITEKEKYDFLKTSIARWENYDRCAVLKNHLEEMTSPLLKVVQGYEYVLPGKRKLVRFPQLKGVRHLKVEITKVNIGKDVQYSLTDNVYSRMISQYGVPGSHKVLIDKDYPAHEPFEEFADSIWVEGMPAGVYLIDYITDNQRLDTIHNYFHVTDIALLMQPLPKRDVRLAVVNSTTGQPMPNAHVDILDKYDTKNSKPITSNCNQYSECVAKNTGTEKKFFAYTDTDWGYREQKLRNSFSYDGKIDGEQFFNLFTDRSIYRPGQTVHVAAIAVENTDGITTKAMANRAVELELVNAQGKAIANKKLGTDDYGTAHTQFVLPEKCLNGLYAVKAGDDYVSFRVEEYKRPTFYVEIEKPTTAYKKGETLTLTGKALGYNGVPVQGAKVSYQVRCSRVFYWWRDYKNNDNGAGVYEAEATTGADGSFQMQVPLLLNAYGGRDDYYRFTVTAQVTDQGGESQQGECSIPLSSKEHMINVDIPQKVLRDSLKTITVNVVNAMGQPVKEHVSFTIQQLYPKEQGLLGRSWIGGDMANEPFDLTRMPNLQNGFPSGAYQIEAYCGNDTIRRQFVVFDLKDTHLAAPTKDWFYVSKEEFPEDGSPVYVQVGSSDADIHVLYTVTTGEMVLDMGRFDLSNEIKTMTFNYKEEYQEGISVAMCWVKDTVFYRHETVISRPLPKKELKMEWITFRDKLTPGQKETWTLRVRQPNGKPVSAQVMATLYDKSLDQLKGHQWAFDHRLDQNTPSAPWSMGYIYDISDTERAKQNKIKVNDLQYDKMDQWLFEDRMNRHVYFTGSVVRPETMQAREVIDIEEQKTPEKETVSAEGLSVRENLSETAFFYPALVTDANGQVALRFTLPESLTTWRFMGLAHDKEMNIAQLVADAVASKTVMVQPNVPRFVRQNDQAAIVSRIVNTSAKTVSGQALLELLDPVTEQVVFSQQQPYTIAPNGQSSVTHNISALTQDGKSLMTIRPLICRVTVKGQGYSDGEQHYLPILPDVEQVVNTRAITQHHPGDVNVDLTKLFAGNRLADVTPSTLTVEYAENPAWMMVQTLPVLAADPADNAISIAATCYANAVSGWLLNASPAIAKTINEWKKQSANDQKKSFVSELQKNEQLKSLLLEETPWALDAAGENERLQQLSDYLNQEMLAEQLKTKTERLKILQQGDGGFAWMKGMYSSTYVTTAVAHILARQKTMTGGNQELNNILNDAMRFLSTMADKEVTFMRTYEREKGVKSSPSEFLIDYLYILALSKKPSNDIIRFVVDRMKDITGELTIYGKATAAVVLATYGEQAKAKEFLESMIEYSVFTEEMGRYFDTKKAYSSWFDYKIPTSVACIEAMKMVDAKANERYIEEMQRWLLQEKRTQAWDTPVNTVNAVHAFLKDNVKALDTTGTPAKITIDGKLLEASPTVAGMGYVNTTIDAAGKKQLSVKKSSEGTSWGAVYAQYYQPVGAIEATQTGVSLKREVVSVNGKAVGQQSSVNVSVGDRVVIRMTVVADRDYDFVQIVDKRAACLEPVSQLSGYQKGCYVSPTDHSTNYFYDQLRKGTHQIETEYYVDRAGTYQSGSATLQCVYAPAFSARDKGMVFVVK